MVTSLFFALILFAENDYRISAQFTNTPPKIDGRLEPLWSFGDSAKNFIQLFPTQGKPASESTTVYLLYDRENLYVAFKSYTKNPKSLIIQISPRDTRSGDNVGFLIDTFDDKTTAYYFSTSVSGVKTDAIISEDGRTWDKSWDGVWFSQARVSDYGYCVEFQIPFKAIRYQTNLTEWGINFGRYIPRNGELSYWAPQGRIGLRISQSGRLSGIKPAIKGLNLEIYPVGLLQYDKTLKNLPIEKGDFGITGGLDLNWHIGSASNIQFTFNPDFAEIEADPSLINLGKYELHLPEKRPFFIEGAELLGGKYPNIQTFYSRRIGRPLPDGRATPILGGIKFITKFERFDFGLLNCLTRETKYTKPGDSTLLTEPLNNFSVLRLQRRFWEKSSLGILYAGKETPISHNYNRSLKFDAAFRQKNLTINCELGYARLKSDTLLKSSFAENLSLNWNNGRFHSSLQFNNVPQDFDVSGIGFEPYKGTDYSFSFGPQFYNWKFFRSFSFTTDIGRYKESVEPFTATAASLNLYSNYHNNWGNGIWLSYGTDYEQGTTYRPLNLGLYFWTDGSKPFSASGNFSYVTNYYNYRRGYFAPNGSTYLELNSRINPNLFASLGTSTIFEWDTTKRLLPLSWIVRPSARYGVTKDLILRIYSELNFDYDFYRANLLLSYNFKPKTWLYFAIGEERKLKENRLVLADRIIILKIRYLWFL